MARKITVRIQGGFGNQLFQYAAGRSLALQTGASLFLNAWEYQSPVCRKYELGKLKISDRQTSRFRGDWEIKLRRRRYAPLRWLLEAMQSPLGYRRIIDARQGFEARLATLTGNLYLDGYWHSERYFADIREQLLQEFTFKEAPTPANADYLARILSQNAVCVHLRRGDYVAQAHFNARFGVCELPYYQSAIACLQPRLRNPAFFVFSDDPAWVSANFPRLDAMTLVTHNVGKDDAEDLRLMMNCKHFIIANSTFSWWAAWLGRCPEKIVIAPKRWFASPEESDRDLVPETWLRL